MGGIAPRKTNAVGLLPPLVLMAACGFGREGEPPGYEIRDSAGIQVVRSWPAEDAEDFVWQISEEPVLQIGTVEGDPAYLFEWITDAVRFPDGRIAVVDRRALDIRIFGEDGIHLETFGGPGPGRREFQGAPVLALRAPDTLLVWDGEAARLSLWNSEGRLLSQRSLASAVSVISSRARGVEAWQVSPEGWVLWAGRAPAPARSGINPAERSVFLIGGAEGGVRDFGVHPMGQGLMLDVGVGFADWFAATSDAALGPGPFRVAISAPDTWEVRFFDSDGDIRRILRTPIPRIPVTPDVRAERRQYLVDWALLFRLPRARGEWVDDQFPVPDSLPAIASLRWDRSGNFWVGRRAPDPEGTERYDVFDRDGRWIGIAPFPRELGRILEIGEDYVLAAWQDDLGVAYLRLYPVLKPGAGNPVQ